MTASRLPAPPEAAREPDPNQDLEPLTLSWDSCVSRALVHRNAVAEVLLTDARALSDGHFLLAAQWPRSYTTSATSDSGTAATEHHDPMLAAETIRQVGLYICQKFLGAPNTSRPVIRNVGFQIDNSAEPVVGYGATDVLCRAEVFDVRHLNDVPYPVALSVRLQFSAAGREFGSAVGRVRVLSDREYEVFRGPNAAAAPSRAPCTDGRRPRRCRSPPRRRDARPRPLRRPAGGTRRPSPPPLFRPPQRPRPRHGPPGSGPAGGLPGRGLPGRLNGCHMHALRFTEWNSPPRSNARRPRTAGPSGSPRTANRPRPAPCRS